MNREKQVNAPRYDTGRVIGRGGCAVVYEAVDRISMRRVALKVLEGALDGVAIARLEREARAALAINHPNVCSTLDFGTLDDGRPYVAMELLEGETLRRYLHRRGRLDAEEAIELGVQMLAGLEAAHELRVVHRDVKPENVFIEWPCDGVPRIKLLDFGVCRRVADPIDDRTLTLAGCVVGTPGYLAPEQAYGERGIDARVDIFAVGLILFEALTGRPAYETKNTTELARALARPLPPLRSLGPVPPELERVIAQATERAPQMRYASAARFQHDLLEARTALRREVARIRRPRHPSSPASDPSRQANTVRSSARAPSSAPSSDSFHGMRPTSSGR